MHRRHHPPLLLFFFALSATSSCIKGHTGSVRGQRSKGAKWAHSSRKMMTMGGPTMQQTFRGRRVKTKGAISSESLMKSFDRLGGVETGRFFSNRRATTSLRAPRRLQIRAVEGSSKRNIPAATSNQGASATPELKHTMATVREQLRLFWQMSVPYFKEENSAKVMLATVIALTLLQSGVSVVFSYVSRDFWSALNTRDVSGFSTVVSRFGLALIAGVPVSVFYRFQREKLALKWREWMTERVLSLYTANRAFYSISTNQQTAGGEGVGEASSAEVSDVADKSNKTALAVTSSSPSSAYNGLDNPDQRIAEDVRSFCTVSLAFFITVLTSLIDLVSFSAILWSIYPQLFVAIVAYASVGTVVTASIGKKLAALNFEQLQREADFRYALMRLRENAESIAFYGGEQQEQQQAVQRLGRLTDNIAEVIRQQRNLEFFTTSYRYLIQILPGTIVAPLYFKGAVELGSVSQSYSAFNHILGDLSLIVNQFEDLARFGAGIDRLGEFVEALQREDRVAARLALDRMLKEAAEAKEQRGEAERKGESGETSASTLPTTSSLLAAVSSSSAAAASSASPLASSSLLALPKAMNETLLAGVREAMPLLQSSPPPPQPSSLSGAGAGKGHSSSDSKADALKLEADSVLSDIASLVGDDFTSGGDIQAITVQTLPQGWDTSSHEGGGRGHSNVLSVRDVSVLTPDRRRTLCSGLSFDVASGSKLLIVGESGTGKSSLLRAIAGLWRAGKGSVVRPNNDEVFFLPQKPYCTLGSLRDQLKYPGEEKWRGSRQRRQTKNYASEDEELLAILDAVKLTGLAEKWSKVAGSGSSGGDEKAELARALDVVQDWSSILSLGEQQRLAFGRLLYAHPSLAILDEATSAMDLETEKTMYKVMEEWNSGISVVSVGHRPSLKAFHDMMLRLKTNEGWEVKDMALVKETEKATVL